MGKALANNANVTCYKSHSPNIREGTVGGSREATSSLESGSKCCVGGRGEREEAGRAWTTTKRSITDLLKGNHLLPLRNY